MRWRRRRSRSLHGVPAALQTRALREVEAARRLRGLGLVARHLGLLFLHCSHATEATEQRSHTGADGGALAGITTDGAADRAEGGATSRAPKHPALRRPGRRGRQRRAWVVTRLLRRPALTLGLVDGLLVEALSALRIDVELLAPGGGGGQLRREAHRRDVDTDPDGPPYDHESSLRAREGLPRGGHGFIRRGGPVLDLGPTYLANPLRGTWAV